MVYIKCNKMLQKGDSFLQIAIQVSFCCSAFGNASSYWLCLGGRYWWMGLMRFRRVCVSDVRERQLLIVVLGGGYWWMGFFATMRR